MPKLSSRLGLVLGALVLLLLAALVPAATAQRSDLAAYIVVFDDSVSDPASVAAAHAGRSDVSIGRVYKHALKGYSGLLSADAASALAQDPRVTSIERDGPVTASTTQSGATWGLDRIDQQSRPTNGRSRTSTTVPA